MDNLYLIGEKASLLPQPNDSTASKDIWSHFLKDVNGKSAKCNICKSLKLAKIYWKQLNKKWHCWKMVALKDLILSFSCNTYKRWMRASIFSKWVLLLEVSYQIKGHLTWSFMFFANIFPRKITFNFNEKEMYSIFECVQLRAITPW